MTREEAENFARSKTAISAELAKEMKVVGLGFVYELIRKIYDSLEQQNTALQARIEELEANEEKLKREWYTIGSDANYKALLNSGKLRQ